MSRRRILKFETEISWFALASALDAAMTFLILHYNSIGRTRNILVESNPLAGWVIGQWGMKGMFVFKLGLVVLVSVIAEVVGRTHPRLAKAILLLGTVVVGAVVVYSFFLLRRNMR